MKMKHRLAVVTRPHFKPRVGMTGVTQLKSFAPKNRAPPQIGFCMVCPLTPTPQLTCLPLVEWGWGVCAFQ